jgi:hypothetical protein
MVDNNEQKKPETNNDAGKYQKEEDGGERETVVKTKKTKPTNTPTMVPIFSKRTGIVVVIGLIVGLAIALAYWLISPSISSSGATAGGSGQGSSGLLGLLGIEPKGPYDSRIRVQVVSPGSEYIPLQNLQQMGEYYGAKASSLPFLKFLADELTRQMPGYTYDVDQLSSMITTEYDYSSELPVIKITVTAATEDEAVGLANLIPQDFNKYLTTEEADKRKKQYESTLQEIEAVKSTLYDAQLELNNLTPTDILEKNQEYVALKAKVDALQKAFDSQATQLVSDNVSEEDIQAQYNTTLQQLNENATRIATANQELQALVKHGNQNADVENQQVVLESKIRALEAEIDRVMDGYTVTSGGVTVTVIGIAEMIANGDTGTVEYTNAQNRVDTITQALATANTELSALMQASTQNQTAQNPDYQVAQIILDTLNTQQTILQNKLAQLYQQILNFEGQSTEQDALKLFNNTFVALNDAKDKLANLEKSLGYDSVTSNLNVKVAQDKVDNLNTRLGDLTEQLGTLVGNNVNTSVTDYLVAGNPSLPEPVLPERGRARNTLAMGAIAGVIVAWVILNYRWLIKALFSTSRKNQGE